MTALDLDRPAVPAAARRPPARRRRTITARRLKTAIPAWLGIAVLMIIGIYPVLWLFLSSFKTQREFIQESTFALPESLNVDNYVQAWTTGNIARNFLNSAIVTAPSLTLTLLFGVGAAFAIEIMRWRGRNLTLLLFVSGIMIPGQMILIPLFMAYFKLGISGTYWPMIITYTGLGMPLTVFLMAAYFRAIPREVFEAATIDGASMLRSFFAIGLPMVRNSLFTIGLVQFLRIWNDLLIALTFTTNPDLRPIQAGLLNFSGEYGQVNYGPLFAGICINVFGLLVLFVILNRQIMKGLTSGALKG
ncbi:carbohydrate ABC transporter permease [Microlunatus parietis]|uniref:Raffinose/stachyose/melibiose transport system permease protein n=1 Tax=Microlunatus parietis TaxID=682979 RepID=A0A7Y9I6W3_9ACTN|nr:carbohydrate ABC transporter permease [Microlunatus parietis]NYE71155.1 raffinose/stachyose/melibiose transport system permease protein [Microlunatus parietis]